MLPATSFKIQRVFNPCLLSHTASSDLASSARGGGPRPHLYYVQQGGSHELSLAASVRGR
jgi:hypothetical protein